MLHIIYTKIAIHIVHVDTKRIAKKDGSDGYICCDQFTENLRRLKHVIPR